MKTVGFGTTFVTLLCLVATLGCSKALTRPTAARLITTQQRLPRAQTIVIAERYLKRSWSKPVAGFGTVTLCMRDDEEFSGAERRLAYYQSQGMLTIDFVRIEGNCPAIYAEVKLTDAGKRHLVAANGGVYEVRAFNLALGEVTGIQSQEQLAKATAEYTLDFADVTPFGSSLSTTPLRATATFGLYDDGWRIEPTDLISAPIRYQVPPDTASLQEARRAIAAAEAAEEASHQRRAAAAAVERELAEQGARQQAIDAKRRATLRPAARVLLERADALHGRGDNAAALEKYMEAVQADSKGADLATISRYAPFRTSLVPPPPAPPPPPGTPAPDEQRVGKASALQVAALRQYLQLRPNDWEARRALLFLVDLSEGESLLAPLLKARPRDPEPYAARAALLEHHNRFAEALESAEKAAQLEPQNPERYYRIGTLVHTAVTKGSGLAAAQKRSLISRALAALERGEALRAGNFESMVYRNLLLRQQAALEADPAVQKKLIAEADELRSRATEIVRRRRSSQ